MDKPETDWGGCLDDLWIGYLAKCRTGRIGIITDRLKDGTWVGKHIEADVYGKKWQSKKPRVLGRATHTFLHEVTHG